MGPDDEQVDVITRVAGELTGMSRTRYLDQVCANAPQLRTLVEQRLNNQATIESDQHQQPIQTPVFSPSGPGGPGGSQADAETSEQDVFPEPLVDEVFSVSEGPGSMVGRYKLLQKIGEGGFGVVYMAEQEHPVKRRVALKIIKVGMDTRQVIARFEAERQALAMMDHPNIAQVLDAGATETGRPFFVMELVKGVPITHYCDEAKLDTRKRLVLFNDVCAAVQHAHQKGIIHRDLKPSNVMVTLHDGKPVVKVIDFGIAKATNQNLTEKTLFTNYGQMIGTPAYMSPEQAVLSGLDVDTRSDVYSLGVMLYELLAGKPPLDDKTLREAGIDEIRRMIREDEPPRPSARISTMAEDMRSTVASNRHISAQLLGRELRRDLDWIVLKAMEKDRTRRYESPSAFAQDVNRYLNDEPVVAAAPSTAYRLRKFVKRNRGPVFFAASIAALLVCGTTVSLLLAAWAMDAEQLAVQRLEEVEKERDAKEAAARNAEAIAGFMSGVLASPDPRVNGLSVTVVQTLDVATRRIDQELAEQPEQQARLRLSLGKTYHGLGLYDRAIDQLEKARDYYQDADAFGPEHHDTLAVIEALGSAYHENGDRDKAIRLRRQILDTRKRLLADDDPEVIRAMSHLANSYDAEDQTRTALLIRQNALRLCEQNKKGPADPALLTAKTNLANTYYRLGRHDEALQLRTEAYNAYEAAAAFGPQHPQTLKAKSNLALSLWQAGDRSAALQALKEVAEDGRAVLGEHHPDRLHAMNLLATCYLELGQEDRAIDQLKYVYDVRRGINAQHPDTLATMNNLASAYDQAGQTDLAMNMRKDLVGLFERVEGTHHIHTLKALHNLANSHQNALQWDEALAIRHEVIKRVRDTPRSTTRDLVWALDGLANTQAERGQTGDAIQTLEEAFRLHPLEQSVAFKLAALYVWVDTGEHNEDYQRICHQLLQPSETARDQDAAQVLRVLTLRGVAAGTNQIRELTRSVSEWKPEDTTQQAETDLVLGAAEYRAKNYEQAISRFKRVAETTATNEQNRLVVIKGIADLYRVLCLHQLSDQDQALQQFEQFNITPLPEDGKHTLAKDVYYDVLHQWIVYREAKQLLKPELAAK